MVNRRHFMSASAAALAAAVIPAMAAAPRDVVPYSRAVYEKALAGGGPFMLDFYADW